MSLLIVILNYKTAQLTIDCLDSLSQEIKKVPFTNVVVVDNDSADGSSEKIHKAITENHWQDWASLIVSPENGGYAKGNNLAIGKALSSDKPPDYIWLLNPDTVVLGNTLMPLLNFLQENQNVGIVGSCQEDTNGILQRSSFRFPTIWSELDGALQLGILSRTVFKNHIVAPEPSSEACPTDWVSGASMMVRTKVFEQVGLLDEEYFLYFEELDFCLQSQKKGWQCWYVPESKLIHLAGQSTGLTDPKIAPKRKPKYWFDSRRRYLTKNYGTIYTALTDIFWIFGFSLWSVRRSIQRKPYLNSPHFFKDFLRHSILFSQLDYLTKPPSR